MDLQYIGESSLAIAQYVTGYVTKAENSNMQDLWQEVSAHSSVYSKLWLFGIRCLRSRECGLYEASDLLLGDHLCEKSTTIKWIDVLYLYTSHRNTPLQTLQFLWMNKEGVFLHRKWGRDPKTHRPSKWKCTSEFKHLTIEEKQRIVDLKSMFASLRTVRRALDAVDSGCQNGHYPCKATGIDLAGHPLMCAIAGCESKLRTLRAAAPHYPVLRTLLAGLYESIRYHKFIASIDSALRTGKFALMCRFCDYRKLFSSDLTGEASVARPSVDIQKPNMPDVESELRIKHAYMIEERKHSLLALQGVWSL